jgi:murein DD-endopeptidase MepM/ murein hydrolase activator NlpD
VRREPTFVAPPPKKRGIGRQLLSGGALLCAGALAVGLSVPASAFVDPNQATASTQSLVGEGQTVEANASGVENDDLVRSKFGASTKDEIEAKKFEQSYARGGSFTPTTGSVRWPFPYSVGISSWFGPRKSPVPGTSSFHKGIDFTPGEGAPTFAVADGTISMASLSPYGLGFEVIIESKIGGHAITFVYGHLEMNSSPFSVGDSVKVGEKVGKTGSTGTVTGANMHLEVHVDGVPVDPYTWLQKNAN